LPGAEIDAVLNRLILQVLARRVDGPRGIVFELAEHLRERWLLPDRPGVAAAGTGTAGTNLVTDQAGRRGTDLVTDQAPETPGHRVSPRPLITSLTKEQRMLLSACDTPRPQKELMELLKVSHRAHFREFHLQPLLIAGLLQLQFPDSPRHPRQRYVLTAIGAQIVQESISSRPDGAA
jgi:hypothetical protein